MKTISIREFASLSEADVYNWRKDLIKVKVIDDDGQELISNTYDLILTWYGLEIHRRYPDIPYSIKEIIHCKIYDDEALRIPVTYILDILMDIVHDPVEADLIKQIIFVWHFKINNVLVHLGSPGVISATAEDVAKVFYSEPISKIRDDLLAGKLTYDEAEEQYKHEIMYNSDDVDINTSTFVMLARTGGVAVNQGFQLMISRGSGFDLNNTILPNPIENSYAEGITNLADNLVETRAAGKSLVSNGKALKDSEWFHRKLHITASPIKTIDHYVDCGTSTGVPMVLTSTALIKAMIGKNFIDDEGITKVLTRSRAKKLKIGETLSFRSIAYCRNTNGPCAKCYGQLRMSVPYNVMMHKSASPGMLSGTAIGEPIGQGMLSTKHFLRHAMTEAFTVMLGDEEYIHTDGDHIFINEKYVRPGTKLLLPLATLSELSDFKSMENTDDIQEDRLSNFETLGLKFESDDPMLPGTKTTTITHLTVTVSSRSARLSKEFIDYIIEKGWEKTKKNIEIDLSEFNPKEKMLVLPYVYEDLDKFRKEIERFITFPKPKKNEDNKYARNAQWMQTQVTPERFGSVLSEFWGLVDRKFKNINIVHMETLLYATMVVDPESGLYRLPVGDEPRYFSSFKNTIENRGIGSLMIYQGQIRVFQNPNTYFIKERQDTAFESFFYNAVT